MKRKRAHVTYPLLSDVTGLPFWLGCIARMRSASGLHVHLSDNLNIDTNCRNEKNWRTSLDQRLYALIQTCDSHSDISQRFHRDSVEVESQVTVCLKQVAWNACHVRRGSNSLRRFVGVSWLCMQIFSSSQVAVSTNSPRGLVRGESAGMTEEVIF